MTMTPLLRAAASNFATCGIEATQRGRAFSLQACLMRSMTSSAVVLADSVTGLSSGGGGALMLCHSSTMVCACEGAAAVSRIATAANGNKERIDNMDRFLFPGIRPKGSASDCAVKRG